MSLQVKDVFLPWYNAYRFLVQNAKRLEVEGSAPFVLINQAIIQQSSNVLDHWINSATQSLALFVRKEMDAYRLYTVSNIQCLVHLCDLYLYTVRRVGIAFTSSIFVYRN